MEIKNYRKEFFKSPQHIYMALGTVGAGILSGQLFGVALGFTAYALGWIFMPDTNYFKKKIDDKESGAKKAEENAKAEAFRIKQAKVLSSLNEEHLEMYKKLKGVCYDIEKIFVDAGDDVQTLRLGSLDKLMWAYLRLLGMKELLTNFLETEAEGSLDDQIDDATKELKVLNAELKENKDALPSLIDTKERVIKSKQDRLDALKQRRERVEQAKNNLEYVIAEQERLHEQILLMRSDVMASRDAQSLSLKIDATVDHIEEANKIMKEFEGISEITDDVPLFSETRMGYGEVPESQDSQIDTSTRRNRLREKN
jgi:chromosome segregation ATPase